MSHPRFFFKRSIAAVLAGLSLLSGCAHPDVKTYADERPRFDLRTYFNGPVRAHGMFQDRTGRIVKRFTVDMVGRWEGNVGVLDEQFVYADGQREQRIWTLTQGADGRYTGTAADVSGTASGQVAGPAFHWTYTLQLPVDGRVYEVEMDDWMVMIDEQTVLNRATMRKWGIRLGEVTLTFHKDRQP